MNRNKKAKMRMRMRMMTRNSQEVEMRIKMSKMRMRNKMKIRNKDLERMISLDRKGPNRNNSSKIRNYLHLKWSIDNNPTSSNSPLS